MTEEEARAKYEDKIWNLLLESRQIGGLAKCASIMLTRVLDDMANDGFYPQLAISAIDPGLHGMAIIKIPEEELKRVRAEYAKKYNENPLLKKERLTNEQKGQEEREAKKAQEGGVHPPGDIQGQRS